MHAFEISVVSPNPSKCLFSNSFRRSGSTIWRAFLLIFVTITPGEIQFTRIFLGANSTARLRTPAMIAPFEKLYNYLQLSPTTPIIEDRKIMLIPLLLS